MNRLPFILLIITIQAYGELGRTGLPGTGAGAGFPSAGTGTGTGTGTGGGKLDTGRMRDAADRKLQDRLREIGDQRKELLESKEEQIKALEKEMKQLAVSTSKQKFGEISEKFEGLKSEKINDPADGRTYTVFYDAQPRKAELPENPLDKFVSLGSTVAQGLDQTPKFAAEIQQPGMTPEKRGTLADQTFKDFLDRKSYFQIAGVVANPPSAESIPGHKDDPKGIKLENKPVVEIAKEVSGDFRQMVGLAQEAKVKVEAEVAEERGKRAEAIEKNFGKQLSALDRAADKANTEAEAEKAALQAQEDASKPASGGGSPNSSPNSNNSKAAKNDKADDKKSSDTTPPKFESVNYDSSDKGSSAMPFSDAKITSSETPPFDSSINTDKIKYTPIDFSNRQPASQPTNSNPLSGLLGNGSVASLLGGSSNTGNPISAKPGNGLPGPDAAADNKAGNMTPPSKPGGDGSVDQFGGLGPQPEQGERPFNSGTFATENGGTNGASELSNEKPMTPAEQAAAAAAAEAEKQAAARKALAQQTLPRSRDKEGRDVGIFGVADQKNIRAIAKARLTQGPSTQSL